MGVAENRQDVVSSELRLNAFPNPMNTTTTISYILASRQLVTLSLYDATGREVCSLLSKEEEGGTHSIIWNGCDNNGIPVQPGVYFIRLVTQDSQQQKKLVFFK